ncbi:MAG: hypothetical protein DRI61_12610 [Chloroflexi bacterium]|nr:MAG: hypothetical protein DRI61_12610 [Chloroflexota bacterium]
MEIIAVYGSYLIRILEIIFPQGKRKYAYYVIHSSEVVVGFDNAPDPQALKLRYGKLYKRHRYEMIPHCHTQGKAALHLTEPMDVERFLAWIEENLPR